jgi:transposase, IS5 family
MTARKNRPTPGFFDSELLLERIATTDHVLWRINALVEWDRFRPTIEEVFAREPKGPGGRPPYDRLLMFKVMVLQHLYNLSDGVMEQRLLGDLFFRHFLGLTFADATPDENTIWLFRNQISDAGVILDLFETFDGQLRDQGLIAKEGIIIDASIVPAPVQHIPTKDRESLERGQTPATWQDKPAIQRQRDTDAVWTKKHNKSYFGYKNHIKMDRTSKLICTFEVTPANDHDSQLLATLIGEEDTGQELHADAAYAGAPIRTQLRKNKVKDRVHRKAAKNAPLSQYQKKQNNRKSKVRARVEHVFGAIHMKLSDVRIRSRGLIRATFGIGMRNLAYNMCRSDFLMRTKLQNA